MYLIESNEGLFLLDSGCRCDVDLIKNYIEIELKRDLNELKIVLVTHAHPDHSGGAYFYKKRFGTKIAGPVNINKWYGGLSGIITYWIDILLTYLVALRKDKGIKNIIFPRKLKLDFDLVDGSKVPGFENWEVLHSPGHTADDLTIYCKETQTAYIADKIVGSSRSFFRPYPLTFPDEYKKSLKRYMNLGIETFLLAHHGENKIPYEKIQDLIDGAPRVPRVHKNTLRTILKQLIKAFLR